MEVQCEDRRMKRTKLINARLVKGWSQEIAAEKLSVTRVTLSQWESGKAQPHAFHIQKLCTLYQTTPDELDIITMEIATHNVWADDLLGDYEKGIAACQDLYYSGKPHHVAALLPMYCRQTAALAQQPSLLQQPAARLASLAHCLAAELFTDREDFGAAERASKAALSYAELAGDTNLQIAALIETANLGFHRKLTAVALKSYEHAVSLLGTTITPLLKGRTYAGMAEVHAMRGEFQESMRAMGLAYEYYPEKPENDPAYTYTRISRYSLYVFADLQSRLFLAQPKEAANALIALFKENNQDATIEPITRLDLQYYQAEICLHPGLMRSKKGREIRPVKPLQDEYCCSACEQRW